MNDGGITIRLLGRLEVTLDGRRVEDELRGSQGKLCFAYLVLNRDRAVPRAELEDAIWPGEPPSDPGAALSTLLSRLRKALGAGVIEGRSELRFVLPDGCTIDCEVAKAALADAERDCERDPAGVRPSLDRAADALAQELLAGHEAPWLDEARRDQDDLRLTALELSTRVASELGDLGGTERSARELIRSFPYRESAHRHLMESLARQGNTAEALRVYDDLRLMLRDELGTAPSRQTIDLHGRLLSGDEAGAPLASRSPARTKVDEIAPALRTSLDSDHPFVGRRAELGALNALFEARGGGAARLALVHGDPGIGKTRLCAELAAGLAKDGTRILYGRSEEVALSQFQPFVQALGAWAIDAPRSELEHATSGLPEAARLVPQLRRRLPELPEPAGEVDRLIVFEDVAEMLARASRSRPMLLVLDDLHWADQPTLLLLTHLVRSPQPIDCLIVGTYRITELDSPLTDVVADLGRDGTVGEVVLDGLKESDVAELVEASTGVDATDAISAEVSHRTEGNPFFVSGFIRELASSKSSPGDEISVPRDASAMVERRLRGMDRSELDILTLAAMFGRDFTFDLLQKVSGHDPEALAALLERSAEARVAQEVPGTIGRYSFDHALIQDHLYQRAGGQRRAQLHLRVAKVLDEISAANREPYIELLAHHYGRAAPAGVSEAAIQWSTLAGDHAEATHAHERAAAHYREAIDLLGDGSPTSQRTDLLMLEGESLVRSGQTGSGRESLLEAAEAARSMGDGERLAKAALIYGDSGGAWSMSTGEADEVLTRMLEEALELLDEASGTRARVCGRLACELVWAETANGRPDELGRESVALARRDGDPDLLYRTLVERSMSIWTPQGLDERLDLTAEALKLSREVTDRSAEANAAMWHGVALAEDSQNEHGWEVVGELADASVAEARNAQLRWVYTQITVNQAIAEGRMAEAGERIGAMLAEAPFSASGDPQMAAAYSGFLIAREREQLGLLGPVVDEQLETVERAPALAALRLVAGLALVELDRREEAADQIRALGAGFEALGVDATWSLGVSHAAELIAELGDGERAARLYDVAIAGRAERICVVGGGCGMLGSMQRYLGLLASTAGDYAQAIDHLERAIEINERKGGSLEAAHSRVDLAAALLGSGAMVNGRANRLLKEATVYAEDRDLARLRRRAEETRALVPAA